MKIQILVSSNPAAGIKKGAVVFVSKTKDLGSRVMYGVKSPIPGTGLVWFSQKEIREV
jgi:hypothetical protein